ncbi:uroporphyrinogen-III C-methyltransferase [Actinotalea fermentans]|uniref:uroporphyrinogen-III C-methyltransferase n=1 Tax=Actinotalea fermentans TaxID=43671 RepID=A0A511YUC8_9CELL|nr:uroporphyrinogen-III C-methyltransferase [Actinotalea fermentans]KGM15507.1 siroheme synthase CysG [Actinotalea fermentans ATCC 43279 = JCM 9966 = DSM 3133]GEN78803.1 uroporphyrinogen-III C-methyltransferase [Actinotalea fermentans]
MTTLLGLDLRARRVLLAGGGPVAARRAAALLGDGADLRVVAPQLCEDLAELAAAGGVEWCARRVREDDLDDVWLVHAATGDRAVDAALARWSADRHLWCVVASAVEVGTARTPASAVVGDVRLGVVSEGAPDPGRTRAVSTALAAVLREGRVDLRRQRPGRGRVVLVGGGPGDPDLLTLRGRRALAEADVVVTDRLGPAAVLGELAPGVEVVPVGKAPGHHPVPQEEINQILVERAARGQVVVRLKGGDPFVYGRGGEEVSACRAAGVDVEVVPGVSSALAAPAAAGIPLTHRGTTAALHVVNGHDGLDAAAATALRDRTATVVVLMGVESLPRLVAHALRDGADPDLPVAIVERATTATQRVTRARLDGIVAVASTVGVRAPAVVVLGDVAAPGLLDPPPGAAEAGER